VLHPPLLDSTGLDETIRDYVQGFTKRSGIHVKLEFSSLLGRLRRDVELTLFRIVQESLTNIHRHSSSRQAKIRIDRDAQFTLEIIDANHHRSDLGPPEKPSRPEIGVGISSMYERVKLIGGCLDVDFAAHGTTVRVTIPLEGATT